MKKEPQLIKRCKNSYRHSRTKEKLQLIDFRIYLNSTEKNFKSNKKKPSVFLTIKKCERLSLNSSKRLISLRSTLKQK